MRCFCCHFKMLPHYPFLLIFTMFSNQFLIFQHSVNIVNIIHIFDICHVKAVCYFSYFYLLSYEQLFYFFSFLMRMMTHLVLNTIISLNFPFSHFYIVSITFIIVRFFLTFHSHNMLFLIK